MVAGASDHRPVVAGRPQRGLRLGPGPRRPRLRCPPHRDRRALRGRRPGPGSPCAARRVTASPARRWRCASTSRRRVRVRPGGAAGSRGLRRPGRPAGRGRRRHHVGAGAPRRPRRGDPRRRLGGAVRAAMVDEAGAAAAAFGAPRVAPLRPARSRCPGAPTKGRATLLDRPRSDAGLPRGARPYVPGDARRLVHWRSTAHAGQLDGAGAGAAGGRARDDHRGAARWTPRRPSAWRKAPWASVVGLLEGGAPGPPRHTGALGSRPRRRWRTGAAPDGAWPGPSPGRAMPPPRRRRARVSVVDAVRRANQPGVPEDSVRLRLACLGAVLVAIAACASLGEIAWTTAVGAMVLVSAGTAFSHATRARPPGWVKVLVAVGAIAACVWFFHAVELAGGGHHVRRQPADGAAGRRPGGALLPRAVPARPALHARRVGRADGGRGRAGDRPPLRSLRRGVGLLRPLGPDRDVDVGQRRGPHLGVGSRAGAGGDVDGGGRRLPGPAGAGRLVARLLHRPGRRRRLGRGPRGTRRRLRRRGAAVPCRQLPPAGSASAAISASPPA